MKRFMIVLLLLFLGCASQIKMPEYREAVKFYGKENVYPILRDTHQFIVIDDSMYVYFIILNSDGSRTYGQKLFNINDLKR